MSEAKHTKGPWFVDATKAFGPMGVYSKSAQQERSGVCWFDHARTPVNGVVMPRAEVEANARLISAAPDLLAALLQLLDDESPFVTSVDDCECGENGNGFDNDGNPCAHIQACRAIAKATGGPPT